MTGAASPGDAGFLAGALARRLAHDLAGPLAAMVTLADISPETDPMMAEAIAQLNERLSLFRLLFGGEPDAAFDRSTALTLLSAYLQFRRHSLQAELPVADREARGMLLLAFAASDILAGAGQLTLRPARLQADGRLKATDSALVAALLQGCTSDPGLVPAACAAALLGPIAMETSETGLVFSVRDP